ncbi:MAG: hypothetical protein AAGE52_25250 [Myxococcota bacterium]
MINNGSARIIAALTLASCVAPSDTPVAELSVDTFRGRTGDVVLALAVFGDPDREFWVRGIGVDATFDDGTSVSLHAPTGETSFTLDGEGRSNVRIEPAWSPDQLASLCSATFLEAFVQVHYGAPTSRTLSLRTARTNITTPCE